MREIRWYGILGKKEKDMKENERFVLYLSGGMMRGVFGAGVVTHLQDRNLYPNIEAIYASSAGAITAAYFLARQTRLGSSIYWEDLISGFISKTGFWGGCFDRVVDRYLWKIPHDKIRDAVNLDHLFGVITTKKHLPIDVMLEAQIPLHVKVFDIEERKIRYIDVRECDPLTLLRASACLIPYVHDPVYISGRACADASIIEPIGFEELRQRHPKSKIVIVFSGDTRISWKMRLKNRIEGAYAYMMYGQHYYQLYAQGSECLRRDLELIARDENAKLITHPAVSETLTRTQDARKLLATYRRGIESAQAIEGFLNG